mgnify:CR=1 FL=1
MIKSMTGFGRGEYADENRKFIVEMKAVNHRYLDVGIKMPKKLNFFESAIRGLLKEYMERGKVDIFISYEDFTGDNFSIKYNASVAAQYLTYLKEMSEQFGLENDIRVSSLSRYPEVFTMEEQSIDEEALWAGLEKALRQACEQMVESRLKEGEHLKNDGSRERIALGQAWRTAAGKDYRYYMVFENDENLLPGAVGMSQFIDTVKAL